MIKLIQKASNKLLNIIFTSICHNLAPVNQSMPEKKKGASTLFEKKAKLLWRGLPRQYFLKKQSMILRKVFFLF